jgi:S-sulfosulfanyl-L-cysteine sulfohydrolase
MEASKRYKVAGWAPVAAGATGEPVWEVAARYLRAKRSIAPLAPNRPRLVTG